MLNFGNKEFRNLQEQVLKNMDDIDAIKEGSLVIAEFGIKIIGHVDDSSELPDPSEYEGDYGDAYLVGESDPYDYYVFTRAFEGDDEPSWLNIGVFPQPGPQGPQGETGATGPEGATGPQGPKGDKGDTGLQGPQGPKGEDGADGATGPQGPQGEPGTSYIILGTVDDESELPSPSLVQPRNGAYLVGTEAPYDLYVVIGTSELEWFNAGAVTVGPQGPQGPTGPQGEKGDKGDKGDTGATGATGAQGPQGIQGIQGETGAQGPTGEQGPKGDTGDPVTITVNNQTYSQSSGNITLPDYPTVLPTVWGDISGTLADQTDLATALGAKANSADLGTAAAKDYTNSVTENSTDLVTSGAVYDAIAGIGDVFTIKGSVATVADLPSTGNSIGDVYYVASEQAGFVWIEINNTEQWEELGPSIDLSIYAETADLANVAFSGSYNDLSNTPTNLVTTNTTQTINGTKTFNSLITKSDTLVYLSCDDESQLEDREYFKVIDDDEDHTLLAVYPGWDSDDSLVNVDSDEFKWKGNTVATTNQLTWSQITSKPNFATVATSGSYNDLSNTPTIGNATITIQKNGTSVDSFTTNATSNKTINITVPTNADYVSLTGNQTIAGIKTFTSDSGNRDLTINLNGVSGGNPGGILIDYDGDENVFLNEDVLRFTDENDHMIGISGANQNLFRYNGTSTFNYALPDASGTLALTSNIPSLTNYVTTNTTQTISGTKSFIGKIIAKYDIDNDGPFEIYDTENQHGTTFELSSLSEDTVVTLPATSGTLALTSDIPTATVLWSRTPDAGTGNTGIATINLSDSLANYNYIIIDFNSNDRTTAKGSATFSSLESGDEINLVYQFNNTSRYYCKITSYTVTSNTQLTLVSYSQFRGGNNEATTFSYATDQANVRPYKITGYKF